MRALKPDILAFLRSFHEPSDRVDEVFRGEKSYWFAVVLYRRFIRDGAVLMACEEPPRFAVQIGPGVFDITGDVTNDAEWVPYLSLRERLAASSPGEKS